MNTETLRILDSIARDRNLERDVLIQDLEQAMISALRKHFNSLDTEEFGCEMDKGKSIEGKTRKLTVERLRQFDGLSNLPDQEAKQVAR